MSDERAIWDSLSRDMKDTLLAIANGEHYSAIHGGSGRALWKRGLAERPLHVHWNLTDLGRQVYAAGIAKARAATPPPTPVVDVETVSAVIAENARLRAALAGRDALLNKGANLINYSVSGLPVPILDWTRHIADVRAALGDAYREYDARTK